MELLRRVLARECPQVCKTISALSAVIFMLLQAPAAMAQPRTAFVHLFEWKWTDIAQECENFLGPKGFAAVQVSPPNEHRVAPGRPWWERYQPVGYQLVSRSGSRAEFTDMVRRCDAVGVKVYVDVVINHMTGPSFGNDPTYGTGIGGSPYGYYSYPAYSRQDFHGCGSDIADYGNRWQVQNCNLVELADLDTGADYVRNIVAAYLNDLVDLGVAGFRIDAAKHMASDDIRAILSRVRGNPEIIQEVIEAPGEPIQASEYFQNGLVTEFDYGKKIAEFFRNGPLASLRTFGEGWAELMPSYRAVAFVDNHDNQRGHGGAGQVITHRDGRLYDLANVFMLAWPYGYPRVMSSYAFSHPDEGPPSSNGNINSIYQGTTLDCFDEWKCEHRWRPIANMVAFRNHTLSAWSVDHWWDNGGNQIAFGRGDKGFVVINRESNSLQRDFQTALPPGEYCNAWDSEVENGGCTGTGITVGADGSARFRVEPWTAVAIHVGLRPVNNGPSWQRTVVFIHGETITGQDMFIRGGIDHDYANGTLGRNCDASNLDCAIPIRHRNLRNATTKPWKHGDHYLDWYGQEAGQNQLSHGIPAQGTPLDWTIDTWPQDWGEKRSVPVHGFGEEALNSFGGHYWMLDVDMDCSKTVNGWFELKSFISNGPGWEADVRQPGTPYVSRNHFARCGRLNVFERNRDEPVTIAPLP